MYNKKEENSKSNYLLRKKYILLCSLFETGLPLNNLLFNGRPVVFKFLLNFQAFARGKLVAEQLNKWVARVCDD